MKCESSISIFHDGLQYDFSDVHLCAEHIVRYGFSIVKVPTSVGETLCGMRNDFSSIVSTDKVAFSFPKRTDGFMPLGTTFARDEKKIDLCETFNYWYAYCHEHGSYSFSKSDFYTNATKIEAIFDKITLAILNGISSFLDFDFKWDFRGDSY